MEGDSNTRKTSMEPTSTRHPKNTFSNATYYDLLFWRWPYPLLKLGLTRPLIDADLPELRETETSNHVGDMVERVYSSSVHGQQFTSSPDIAIEDSKTKTNQVIPITHPNPSPSTAPPSSTPSSSHQKQPPSFIVAMLYEYLKRTAFLQPILFFESIAHIVQALALGYLIAHFKKEDADPSEGFLWSFVIVVCSIFVLLAHHTYFFFTWLCGLQFKAGSISALFRKSLRLKASQASMGKVINLATNDVERFYIACIFLPYLVWGPVEAVVVCFLGVRIAGFSFLAGYSLLLFFVPMQYYLSQKFADLRSKVANITDKRVTLISQCINGIGLTKMCGWEDNFTERLNVVRNEEIEQIQKANKLKSYNEALFFVCNVIIALVIFSAKVLSGGVLKSEDVFTVMVLVNIVQFNMAKFFTLAVMGTSEILITLRRMDEFLASPEIKVSQALGFSAENENAAAVAAGVEDDVSIRLDGLTTYWDDDFTSSGMKALDNVNLTIKKNTLNTIIGPVGSGKSALLLGILNEQQAFSGSVYKAGTVAYASQQPFILSGSITSNILFGLPMDPEYYRTVVNAVGLDVDFITLPNKDQTLIGDRGVNLSGGQRARIGLARCIYARCDILLLDDVLSAVDSSVARKIFHDAIKGLVIDSGSTVVLVTHAHQFCYEELVSNVLFIGGRVEFVGDYIDCVNNSKGTMSLTIKDDGGTASNARPVPIQASSTKDDEIINAITTAPVLNATIILGESDTSNKPHSSSSSSENKANKTKLVVPEDTPFTETSTSGKIKLSTWINYAKAMGSMSVCYIILFLLIAGQVALVATMAIIGVWARMSADDQQSMSTLWTVWGLGLLTIFLSFARAESCFYYCIKASLRLHDSMVTSVLRAPISFFHVRPSGLILNRFSADVGVCDDMLVATLYDFLMCFLMCIGAILTAVYVLPPVVALMPFLIMYFARLRFVYLQSSREIKRLEAVTRSPVYSMLSETLGGLSTIRCFPGAVEHFKKQFEVKQNANVRSFFAFIATTRWLGFRLDAICFALITAACLFAVGLKHYTSFEIDPSILGLALMMLIQLSGLFQWAVRQSAECENMMISVERILEFSAVPSEPELVLDTDTSEVLSTWPTAGKVELKHVTAKYRPDLPPSLNDISFAIAGGERVGVIGRTGSGKSTLLQVLFRLLDECEGEILIDSVNVNTIGLHKLRKSIGVIPQTPVLFDVSLRDALDPFGNYQDEHIIKALETVQMLDVVNTLKGKLDYKLTEGGNNFSVGQRQLLCLARAVLLNTKIIILDEPSANVDNQTDMLLQAAISKSFQHSTIISIAHRISTIIDFDKVLILGAGKVVAFGAPFEMLKDEKNEFSRIVDETGAESAKLLRRQAFESGERRKVVV